MYDTRVPLRWFRVITGPKRGQMAPGTGDPFVWGAIVLLLTLHQRRRRRLRCGWTGEVLFSRGTFCCPCQIRKKVPVYH